MGNVYVCSTTVARFYISPYINREAFVLIQQPCLRTGALTSQEHSNMFALNIKKPWNGRQVRERNLFDCHISCTQIVLIRFTKIGRLPRNKQSLQRLLSHRRVYPRKHWRGVLYSTILDASPCCPPTQSRDNISSVAKLLRDKVWQGLLSVTFAGVVRCFDLRWPQVTQYEELEELIGYCRFRSVVILPFGTK